MKNIYRILQGMSARPGDRFGHETNDCTVNAISNVTSQPYPVVHAYLKAAGRRDRGGFYTYRHFGSERTALGHKFTNLNVSDLGVRNSMTVGRFAKTHTRGRYLVTIHKHALCVVDGTIIDSARAKPRARIRSAWLVESLGKAPTIAPIAPTAPAPARRSFKMRKVARGHFKTTVAVSVTEYGITTRRLADLEIIGAGAFRRAGVPAVGHDWTWKLSLHLPGAATVVQSEKVRSLAAAKALFSDPNSAHRNWTHSTLRGWTPTGSY
jgi:hypothetical protein